MTTYTLNRRGFLGTSANAMAAVAAFSGMATAGTSRADATQADVCIANHRQLAQNLKAFLQDGTASQSERAFALKTCHCVHCNVAIAPML